MGIAEVNSLTNKSAAALRLWLLLRLELDLNKAFPHVGDLCGSLPRQLARNRLEISLSSRSELDVDKRLVNGRLA
jgi:hypothetical protein